MGADTTILAAFAVGLASFFSPCVLPLVPGYLSAVSGVSIADLQAGKHRWWRVLLPSLAFVGAFSAIFILLGITATSLGSTLQQHRQLLQHGAGVMIIVLGLFFISTPFVSRLNRQWHPEALMKKAGSGGPIIAGAAFAIAWTPCVGPTLGAILTAAATKQSVGNGAILLAFYGAGLAVPFLLTALAFDRATTAFGWLRRHHLMINAIAGATLIAMGYLIFTNRLTTLNVAVEDLLTRLGINLSSL